MLKNTIISLLLFLCSVTTWAQFSSDASKPLSISEVNSLTGNVKIATTSQGNSYIAWENYSENEETLTLEMQYLDIDGNKKWADNLIVSDLDPTIYTRNDFNLLVNSKGEAVISFVSQKDKLDVFTMASDKNIKVKDGFSIEGGAEFAHGHSIVLDSKDSIIVATPLATVSSNNTTFISKIGSLIDLNVSIAGATMPKLCLGKDNSFYVVYMLNNSLYADLYDTEFNSIWKATYVGNETGMELSTVPNHVVKPDGDGGLIVLWKKKHAYLQRIITEEIMPGMKDGVRKFGASGLILNAESEEDNAPVFSVDTLHNVVNVAWRSQTSSNETLHFNKIKITSEDTGDNVFAEKLLGNSGITFLTDYNDNSPIGLGSVASSGKALLIFSKFNDMTQNYDLMFTRFEENGDFISNFIPIATTNSAKNSLIASDYISNQMIVAWNDSHADGNKNILAQNVAYSGATGVGASETSINEKININNVEVYPNPVNDFITFNINSTKSHNGAVKIINAAGTVCRVYDVALEQGNSKVSLQVPGLLPGTYYIHVLSDNSEIFLSKFVVD